jgi:hypothetical protein
MSGNEFMQSFQLAQAPHAVTAEVNVAFKNHAAAAFEKTGSGVTSATMAPDPDM